MAVRVPLRFITRMRNFSIAATRLIQIDIPRDFCLKSRYSRYEPITLALLETPENEYNN